MGNLDNYKTPLRVRFAPSPTGYLHVGGARTALYNWLLARKTGGTFILRIEDTDTDRNVAGAEQKIMQDLRWLGLQWDEGIEVGGPYGPYFQTQRMDRYNAAITRLLEGGKAYYAFDTTDELEAMRKQAEAEKRAFHYPRPVRFPDAREAEAARQAGRPVVVRFTMPREDLTVHDEVMGDVTVAADQHDDFVIRKADGIPIFHLANVVDDFDMKINLVVRGQEFLQQTVRHIALQRALGYPTPRYAHVSTILDMKGRKLSKRDGDVEVHSFRQEGYLPEVMVNFIALLGWSPGGDRERMSLAEMINLFSIERIGRDNPKFDRAKLVAFNTEAIAAATPDRLLAAFDDWLSVNQDLSISKANLDSQTKQTLLAVNRGFRVFSDIIRKSGFIYVDDADVQYDPGAVKKVLAKDDNAGFRMIESLLPRLQAQNDWTVAGLESLIKTICESQAVSMGEVAQPIRVAVSGTTVSPAICDTLVLLGKTKTLARLQNVLALRD